MITRDHVEELFRSRVTEPTLVVVRGRALVAAAGDLGTDKYRGALELATREDLATWLDSDTPSERDFDEVAARLDALVTNLGS